MYRVSRKEVESKYVFAYHKTCKYKLLSCFFSIENLNFYSVTIRAFKYDKSPSCVFNGHKAIYNGPYKVIIDDEGHVFPRKQEVEVCTDTVNKLSNPPYHDYFTIIEPSGDFTQPCCSSEDIKGCC